MHNLQSKFTDLRSSMPNKKILVVDDSKVTRSMAVFALRMEGFEIFEADSAREALGLVKLERVDMVITDLRMPEVDGAELVRQIRALEEFAEIPIIMVSGFDSTSIRERIFDAGVSNFLTKPFKPQQLQDLVRSVLC